jgi:tRNA (mo5U34)-methyltransferase
MKNWQSSLYGSLIGTSLEPWIGKLQDQLAVWESNSTHANTEKWRQQLKRLPAFNEVEVEFGKQVKFSSKTALSEKQHAFTEQVLRQFMPWRKGPFQFFGLEIDTEWRSDWKWDRVLPHIAPLNGRKVLDVGCGSGYHLFRMHGEGAEQAIGVEPTALFCYQFHVFKQYIPSHNIHYIPLGIEDLPELNAFDTVFSMGVLYHRRDPIKFLQELKAQLRKGGELVLETLVVEGDENTILMPKDRYAQMRNVWFLPSVDALCLWMQRVGFKDIKLVDKNYTTTQEQRPTKWMENHSLRDFLDPDDQQKTIEGYPAPLRATVIAKK